MKPVILLALLATLAGCSDASNDGRYATFDRGRSNNRADVVPDHPAPAVAVLPANAAR